MTRSGFSVYELNTIPSGECYVVARSAADARRIAEEAGRVRFLNHGSDYVGVVDAPSERQARWGVVLNHGLPLSDTVELSVGWWAEWCRNADAPDGPSAAQLQREMEAAGQQRLFGAAAGWAP